MSKKLTNKHGLPQPLYSAIANDQYDRGDSDVSVTSLLQPPRIAALKIKHAEEIEEDAIDRVWSLLGQSVHTILERADDGSELSEERLTVEISGVKVSGQFDRFVVSSGTVQDYKVTTAYKFKSGEAPLDFQRQLNCYAYLLREHGHDVKAGEIVAILRDWSKREAERSPDYPRKHVAIVPVAIRPQEEIKAFLEQRVALWKAAQETLPLCSAEDRWARQEKWAVMKEGRKSAVRLYDNSGEAAARVSKEGAGHYVQHRPGESIRCKSYCNVKSFCSQFKNLKGSK